MNAREKMIRFAAVADNLQRTDPHLFGQLREIAKQRLIERANQIINGHNTNAEIRAKLGLPPKESK